MIDLAVHDGGAVFIGPAMHVAAWEYQGTDKAPVRHQEPLAYENVKPSVRSYK